MAFNSAFRRLSWLAAGSVALYSCIPILLLSPWVQKQALYAHLFNTRWWADPNQPEHFGFLAKQVTPFNIQTSDDQDLYAWHVLPTGLYSKHQETIRRDSRVSYNRHYGSSKAFKLLAQDPDSRLVISFHGNAGTVSQGWRPDCYRTIASADPSHIHVWTVDYRGFGHSSGTPSETGLIKDGIATVDFALNVAGIPPERMVIVGQSLGTAVSIAVAEHFVVQRDTEFKGIVLIAPFTDISELILEYAIAGIVPLLSPLRALPKLQKLIAGKVTETWNSARRLASLVRASKALHLHMIHAKDDWDIPWKHSDMLFYVAANATSKAGMSKTQINGVKLHDDLGKNNWVNSWKAARDGGGVQYIREEIVSTGGHNRVTTHPVVAKAVLEAFEGKR